MKGCRRAGTCRRLCEEGADAAVQAVALTYDIIWVAQVSLGSSKSSRSGLQDEFTICNVCRHRECQYAAGVTAAREKKARGVPDQRRLDNRRRRYSEMRCIALRPDG